MEVTYRSTTSGDADNLVRIRIAAMQESLERVGRFEPQRARDRFLSSFEPESTQYIVSNGLTVGFFVVKQKDDELLLDHLYIEPKYQGKGIGAAVLQGLFSQADSMSLPIRVGALRESASNRFYQRLGFAKVAESEWDIYYIRQPGRKD